MNVLKLIDYTIVDDAVQVLQLQVYHAFLRIVHVVVEWPDYFIEELRQNGINFMVWEHWFANSSG